MIGIPYLYNMNRKLWNILYKYDNLEDFSDSISRIIQGTQSDADYINIYGNYSKLETKDANDLDSIVGEKIAYILS